MLYHETSYVSCYNKNLVIKSVIHIYIQHTNVCIRYVLTRLVRYIILVIWCKCSPFRFSASDGKGGVASNDVIVNLCNCTGHGECQFDQLADGYELKQSFRVVQCNCSKGWEGEESVTFMFIFLALRLSL